MQTYHCCSIKGELGLLLETSQLLMLTCCAFNMTSDAIGVVLVLCAAANAVLQLQDAQPSNSAVEMFQAASQRLGSAAAAAAVAAVVLTTPLAAMADLVQVCARRQCQDCLALGVQIYQDTDGLVLGLDCGCCWHGCTALEYLTAWADRQHIRFQGRHATIACMHCTMHRMCSSALPCYCLQTVPVSQVTQMAKPLPKQTIDKGKVGSTACWSQTACLRMLEVAFSCMDGIQATF
jgi:hypothetical protein